MLLFVLNVVFMSIDHFTVVCLVTGTWPMNESDSGGDLALMETPLLFLWRFQLISMRTTSLVNIRKGGRAVSQQGHFQPHFHLKARFLST